MTPEEKKRLTTQLEVNIAPLFATIAKQFKTETGLSITNISIEVVIDQLVTLKIEYIFCQARGEYLNFIA